MWCGVAATRCAGDGRVDMAFVLNNGSVLLVVNNGNETFSVAAVWSVPNTTTDSYSTASVVDVTGDGISDVVASGSVTTTVFNVQAGATSSFTTGTISQAVPVSQLAVDINGDGRVDVCTLRGGVLNVWLATSSGGFVNGTTSTGVSTLSSSVSCIATGDVDADGDVDLVVCLGSNATTLLNNGNGVLSPSSAAVFAGLTAGLPSATVVAATMFDVDNDGDCDGYFVMNTTTGTACQLRVNNGSGWFSAPLAGALASAVPGQWGRE